MPVNATRNESGNETGAQPAAKGERVAKLIARAGICSRREAERLIAQGRVAVDGKTLETPAVTVDDARRITVDGERLPANEPPRLWRYHKPAGVVTTHSDPQGRPTLFDQLADDLPRVISIGRLDLNSEGLILLTNDGGLARHLELPATGWLRRYRARVLGTVDQKALAALEGGIEIEGVRYGPIKAALDRQVGANAWVTVALREGKNREVRRVLQHLGLKVSRLIRTAYGPFQIGALKPREIAEVPEKVLREQLGATYAALDGTGAKRGHADRRRKA